MDRLPIDIHYGATAQSLSSYFEPGTRRPVVLADAFEHWPARTKCTFDFFADHCGSDPGTVPLKFFGGYPAKVTTLGAYIDALDKLMESLPGFWTDAMGNPTSESPDLSDSGSWGYVWRDFKRHPDFYNDIAPFPPAVPNSLATVSTEILRLIGKICGRDLHSIYLGRAGTVTPMHFDFWHSTGSLFQFRGRKQVIFVDPSTVDGSDPARFDPEGPDPASFPGCEGATAYDCVLEPGQMLVIPPGWWHHARCLEDSITLSCNFFHEYNAEEFLANLATHCLALPDGRTLLDRIEAAILSQPCNIGVRH